MKPQHRKLLQRLRLLFPSTLHREIRVERSRGVWRVLAPRPGRSGWEDSREAATSARRAGALRGALRVARNDLACGAGEVRRG